MKAPKRTKSGKSTSSGLYDGEEALQRIRDRVQTQLTEQKLSMRALSSKAGVGNSFISNLLSVYKDVSFLNLYAVARALGRSPDWLITGRHAVYDSDSGIPRNIRLLFIHTAQDIHLDKPEEDHGCIGVEGNNYPNDCKAMLVESPSMNGEGSNERPSPEQLIVAGDVVIFSPSAQARPGAVVVARSKGAVIVRRLVEGEGGLQLVASNSDFVRVPVRQNEILGPVCGVYRRFR